MPSHLYSFSFAPNPNWSSTFSPQPEILEYLRGVAARFGVIPHVRFGTEMESAEWDEAESLAARDLAGADHRRRADRRQGPLSDPLIPDLPGLDSFEGTTFHSARWDHEHRLDGERVAVIGTGASAIQFVPKIQPLVGQMHVFQRTPPWVMPHPNRADERLGAPALRALPAAQLAMRAGIYWARETFVLQFRNERMRKLATRMALRQLEQQVPDPELRAKLTPRYELGCKRILPTDEWYPALMQPNVDVVTEGVREIKPHSIVVGRRHGARGRHDHLRHRLPRDRHPDRPARARARRAHAGRDLGRLAERLQGRRGGRLPEPVLPGRAEHRPRPQLDRVHDRVADQLRGRRPGAMRRRGARVVDVRPEAQAAYNAMLDQMTEGTVWVSGGCSSYYIDRNGRNSTIWPTFTWPFRQRTREFDEAAYALGAPASEPVPAAA